MHTLQQGVMARETTKAFVTKCPTYGLWFDRFIKGLHSRMGNNCCPNTAICSKLMKIIMTRVEVDFLEEENEFIWRFIAKAGLLFMSSYFGSLHGDEVKRILRQYFINLNQAIACDCNTVQSTLTFFDLRWCLAIFTRASFAHVKIALLWLPYPNSKINLQIK